MVVKFGTGKRRKRYTATVGTVSDQRSSPDENTAQDLADELRRLSRGRRSDREKELLAKTAKAIKPHKNGLKVYPAQDDELMECLEGLADLLNVYTPDFCYFGPNEGNSTCYGFWPYADIQYLVKDDDGLVVSDTSEVPKGFHGYVLHVNDHGNMTLYLANGRRLVEQWSVV
jgi:hypothetical protein